MLHYTSWFRSLLLSGKSDLQLYQIKNSHKNTGEYQKFESFDGNIQRVKKVGVMGQIVIPKASETVFYFSSHRFFIVFYYLYH